MRLLRRRLLVSVFVFIGATAIGIAQQPENVYVTKTGSKYHRATCGSLSKSKIEMPLTKAAARYGACKNCKPPVPAATPATAAAGPSAKPPAVQRAAPVANGRCQATTQKGTQCSRKAQAGRNYCYQH